MKNINIQKWNMKKIIKWLKQLKKFIMIILYYINLIVKKQLINILMEIVLWIIKMKYLFKQLQNIIKNLEWKLHEIL